MPYDEQVSPASQV